MTEAQAERLIRALEDIAAKMGPQVAPYAPTMPRETTMWPFVPNVAVPLTGCVSGRAIDGFMVNPA
jgi:hypothetical protein